MTYKEIQKKLEKCELALTSIQNGTYTNGKLSEKEALNKLTTIKESLEKKLNLLKEEETMFVSTKGGDTKAVSMDTKAAMDLKKDPNITGITTAKGKDLKEDDLSDEEQEEITTETSHTEVVAKEVHKAFIDALQETGHEVSEHSISSLNPETFTLTVKFKNNTQSDYSFEFEGNEVKLDGNILVTTNKKGVTPVLNKTIAKDNSVKYLQNLSEKKGKDHDGDGDIDSDDYMIAKDKAIKANMKEDESEPVADKKGKYTGVRRLKLSDKDKETLKKIEDLLAKEKNENINEENYDYYTKPKHFDICPGAETLRDEVLASGKTPEELGKWTFKHDELFRLEKAVLKSNKADERHVKVAKQLAGEITHHSRDLGIEANKIGYLKGHIKKIQDIADKTDGRGDNMSLRSRDISEGPYQTSYVKVSKRDYKKAISIIDQNIDPTYVKTDIVDDDGAGNVIIYFNFRKREDGDLDENPGEFIYDLSMDLEKHGITVTEKSHDLDEDYDPDQEQRDDEEDHGVAYDDEGIPLGEDVDEVIDRNDPVLMRSRVAKMRADDMAKLDALKKQAEKDRKKAMRRWNQKKYDKWLEDVASNGGAENAFDMAKNAEFEPGLIDWIKKEFPYDDALQRIQWDIEALAETKDTTPAAIDNKKLNKEHISVGHPDNEPGMLKQDVHDIAHYAVKLYKLLKYYESLEDQVDFPHWWQSKVVKAREYISKAAHYLEFKTNEPAIDAQVGALQEGRSANAIKKEYDALVSKMIELAKEYKKAEGEKKKQLVAQLKDHTKTKKALEKELDQAVQKTGAGQELDTSINELSGDQRNDLIELQNILDDVAQKGEEAREIIRQSFPNMLSKADAYGAFDFGSSANRYDTTLESIIEEIEEYYDEEEDDMDEGKYKSDAQRKAIYATKADIKEETKKKIDFFRKVKVGDKVKYLGKDKNGFSKGDTVTVDSFTSSSTFDKVLTLKKDNKKLRVASQSSIGPLEKGNLKEEMDGGRLFDYFKSKGYDITERRPDGYPPKEGVEGYMVSRGGDRYPQAVIFQHNKDTDEFTISRMSGYRIDQKEAIKAGMREAGKSGAAGMDSYMTDGNYTPVDISAEGLKDIVDHVMSGLDREGQAQSDFYKDRGPTSGTIDEDAVNELYDQSFDYENISMDDVKGIDLKPGKYQMVFKHKNGNLDQRNYPDLRSFTAGATQFFEYEHFLKKFGIEDKVRSGEISLKQHEDEFVDKYFDEIIDLINNSSNVILLVNGKPIAGGTIDEGKGGQIIPGDIVKNQHGNYYMRVDGKVGRHDAYVRVTNGKPGKKKTGLHDSFKLTLVNKDELNEGATCCGRCGRVHVKGSVCKRPYLKGKDHCRTK